MFIFQDSLASSDGRPDSMCNISGNEIEKLVLEPAPQGKLIKCRISRDRKGMDRGLFPTYFLHREREDGKKVSLILS